MRATDAFNDWWERLRGNRSYDEFATATGVSKGALFHMKTPDPRTRGPRGVAASTIEAFCRYAHLTEDELLAISEGQSVEKSSSFGQYPTAKTPSAAKVRERPPTYEDVSREVRDLLRSLPVEDRDRLILSILRSAPR